MKRNRRRVAILLQHRARVYVGVNGSVASLRALRQAAALARHRHSELHVVHVRRPVRAGAWQDSSAGVSAMPPRPDIQQNFLDSQAQDVVARCVEDGLGGIPDDLVVKQRVMVGKPAKELARLGWWDDDVLVVGSGRHRLRRLLRRSVGAYCVTHAQCPVLVVPLDHFASAMLRRRTWRRSALERDPWKQFDTSVRRDRQPIP